MEEDGGEDFMGGTTMGAEVCVKKLDEDVLIDSKIEPDLACQAMEVFHDSELGTGGKREETGLVLDNPNIELDCSTDGCPKLESVNTESLLPSVEIKTDNAVELTEIEPCSVPKRPQATELTVLKHDSETYRTNEVFTSTQTDASSETQINNEALDSHCMDNPSKVYVNNSEVKLMAAMNDGEISQCAKNHAFEVMSTGDLEVLSVTNDVKEAHTEFNLESCPKDKVEEASNDDVHSEVSNPNISPKHVTSSLTISSHQLDVFSCDHGGYGEISSACSQTSCTDGSSFKEKQSQNYRSGSVSTTCVALEIPKNVSTTGIRKITFKFRKRKEDYECPISVPDMLLDNHVLHAVHDHKQSSVSAAQLLNSTDIQNRLWNTHENIQRTEVQETQSPLSCVPNREMKMSKKIIPSNYPTNVKKLLSTRILEGARVKYIPASGEKGTPGIIKDCGYLCGCGLCNFSNVVTAYEFEHHAGAKTRHPNNHIYLENGKPIYNIVQELKTASLCELDNRLKDLAGSSINEEYVEAWKANLHYGSTLTYADTASPSRHCTSNAITRFPSPLIDDNLDPACCNYPCAAPLIQASNAEAPVEQKRLVKKPRYSTCSSTWEKKKAVKGGKKRDNDLHKLLFMPNGLPDGTDLAYFAKGKRILGGYKQGNGIICSCCDTELSPSQFEAHAGWPAKRQPYRHIYTSSGLTLHDIAVMLANGQNIVTGGSDDMCAVCGDGGKLILCNGCPRAFHEACLGLQCVPDEDWHCHCCADNNAPGRKISRESKPIILRLTRVVKAPEIETGGCVICRSQAFSAVKFDDLTVILCDQCEKEYHVGCLRKGGLCDLKELPRDKWFCCNECDNIYNNLQLLVSSGPELIPTSVSAALCKKHAAVELNDGSNYMVQWCVLSGKSRHPGHLLILSQAAAIFRECFDPIIAKSGRDLIPVMVYGRNISGQEFGGMYCIVLMVNSVVVSAALLRVFGHEVAELPLVATSRNNQGKGFFQALFSCVEGLLSSMNVKYMVLPAAEEAEPMWTKKLGFTKASHEQMPSYTRDLQLTIFKGTSLLQKKVQSLR